MQNPSPRRRQTLSPAHRKRFSLSRLSSDTAATLPEYTPQFTRSVPALPLPEDDPPGYTADVANEADEDTDSDTPAPFSPSFSAPRRPTRHSYRRSSDSHSQTRRPHPSSSLSPLALSPSFVPRYPPSSSRSPSPSPTDPHLDALLARSVHALELSNSLLQSSMSTHTSLAALLSSDTPTSMADTALEARARGLEARIRVNSSTHAGWVDGLDDIERAMTTFLDPGAETDRAADMSTSLPSNELSPLRQRLRTHARHRSSADLRTMKQPQRLAPLRIDENPTPVGELQLSHGQMPRARLISPAPRALTQYIDADTRDDADASPLLLPSTIGLRASSSSHRPPSRTSSPMSSQVHLSPSTFTHSPTVRCPSPPRARLRSPSSRGASSATGSTNASEDASPAKSNGETSSAMTLLSSFLSRRPSASASTKAQSPKITRTTRRRSSIASMPSPSDVPSTNVAPPSPYPIPVHYHYHHPLPGSEPSSLSHRPKTPSTPSSSHTVMRPSRSPTPTRPSRTRTRSPPPPLVLRPMTPPIEVSSASASSSASTSPSTDPHPNPVLSVQALRKILTEQPAPEPKARVSRGLQPRTQAAPTLGTSHATASVSRLFTRGTHLHAGHPDDVQGRRSAMKRTGPSAPPTPGVDSPVTPAASPTPSSSFLRFPLGGNSASSSGRSTPKRISFAALPESYAGETGERKSSSRSKLKSRKKGKGRERSGSDSPGGEGWWVGWLLGVNRGGVHGYSPSFAANTTGRNENRVGKPWGKGFGGLEDWTV